MKVMGDNFRNTTFIYFMMTMIIDDNNNGYLVSGYLLYYAIRYINVDSLAFASLALKTKSIIKRKSIKSIFVCVSRKR